MFHSPADYRLYKSILGRQARRYELDIWAYCLMPNHIHVIAVPSSASGLARPFGEAHRRYALTINRREKCTGHLWQERFASFPMAEEHLTSAIRYVLLNPVRAGLVASATEWPESSTRAHVWGVADQLVNLQPISERISDWAEYLNLDEEHGAEVFRRHSRIGRPLGSDRFVKRLEEMTGRRLRPQPAGRKPKPVE